MGGIIAIAITAAIVIFAICKSRSATNLYGIRKDELTEEEKEKLVAEQRQREANEAAYRERSKAHQRYLDAKRNYDHKANLYRQCIATGDQNGALIYKQSMDEAYAEMLNSGWHG